MSRAARRAYAYAALIASSFYAAWWGLDIRIAVAAAAAFALALVMLAHNEAAKKCGENVARIGLSGYTRCVLVAGHSSGHVDRYGRTDKRRLVNGWVVDTYVNRDGKEYVREEDTK